MIRAQVQLTEEQQAALRELSAATGRSIADLVREGIEQVLARRTQLNRQAQIERAIGLAGRYSSGISDVSAAHDRHLNEAFR